MKLFRNITLTVTYFQVKYLLINGAVCDSNTFEGERCVYGALTDTIRKLLLDHKMLTTVTKRREAYTEFLRRLWGDEASKDVVFSVHGEEVRGHRFLLSTRCPQLRTMFEVILDTQYVVFTVHYSGAMEGP